MARISLIHEKLDEKFTVETLLCSMSPLKNCLISTYEELLCFSTRIHFKNCWDTPSATSTFEISNIHQNSSYLSYLQSKNTSRTPASPTYKQCTKNVATSLFKFRRMDETPPIGVTMHINSQAASWSNLHVCCSAWV